MESKDMPTQAKAAFDKNIRRATYFLDIHGAGQEGPGAPKSAYRELPRGAIVFAVGSLDAYLCEASAEVLVRGIESSLAPQQLRNVLERVDRELPSLALELTLLRTLDERKGRLRSQIVDYFQNQTSQHGAKAVAATVTRMGHKPADFWSAMSSRNYPDAASDLDRWTDVRHQIVHQGKSPRVWRPHARSFIELAKALVKRLDEIADVQAPLLEEETAD